MMPDIDLYDTHYKKGIILSHGYLAISVRSQHTLISEQQLFLDFFTKFYKQWYLMELHRQKFDKDH